MRKQLFLCFYLLLLCCAGCVTEQAATTTTLAPQGMPGFFHHVEKGQTLWRISKIYEIDLDNLAALNHISDATKIEVGQQIFIPRAEKKPLPVLETPEVASGEDFIWPVKGRVIATFNQTLDNLVEKGIDIRSYTDNTVSASRSGRVVFYNPNFKRYGKTIIIDHNDGFLTVYARNQEILTKIGENVKQGAPIAKAAVLHFEIRKGHLSKNPLFYLP